jgi:hypothetical protein
VLVPASRRSKSTGTADPAKAEAQRVDLLAPLVGATAGGGLYTRLLQPCLPALPEERTVTP